MQDLLGIEGKNAVVTGANGGIGKAICTLFAQNGINIWACMLEPVEQDEKWLRELSNECKVEITPVYFALGNDESIHTGLKTILDSNHTIDIIINCAGITSTALLNSVSIDEIRHIFEINYFSMLYIIKTLSKRMIRAKSGSIVNISSYAGVENRPGRIGYGGSKNAVIYATRTLANEYRDYGIRVNAIAPGPTDTEMLRHYSESIINEFKCMSYDKRLGTPADIAKAVLYLSSNFSSHISGQTIRVDGGM